MLITATSGGGKSGAVFQICEVASPHVQTIILDPEGEFSPLRSHFPFVLVGPDGETPATVKTAGLLAHTLLELGASAIIDLYELPVRERHEFARDFLGAMVDAPKTLWHPVLVIVDESHTFAPEKGQGESVASEAMVNLATRGRKRGYCLVAVTQRLAMLSKTLAANCQNVLVGRTSQIDQARAAETLHISGKAAREDLWRELSRMPVGRFYAYGMAFAALEPVAFQVERAATLPDKQDRASLQPPPTPAAIEGLLSRLAALPGDAEKKAQTEEELRRELTEARRQIRELEAEVKNAATRTGADDMGFIEEARAQQAELERLRVERDDLSAKKSATEEKARALAERLRSRTAAYNEIRMSLASLVDRLYDMAEDHNGEDEAEEAASDTPTQLDVQTPRFEPPPKRIANVDAALPVTSKAGEGAGAYSGPAGRILKALAQFRGIGVNTPSKMHICLFSGYSNTTSKGFANAISSLRTAGLVDYPGDGAVALTAEGLRHAPAVTKVRGNEELHARIFEVLSGPEERILRPLLQRYPRGATKDSLMQSAGYTNATSKGFANSMSRLRTMGFVDYPSRGDVVATKQCFVGAA